MKLEAIFRSSEVFTKPFRFSFSLNGANGNTIGRMDGGMKLSPAWQLGMYPPLPPQVHYCEWSGNLFN